MLVDAPCSDLAQELRQSCATVQRLQHTLQQVLDQREEVRQSKQLLQLYLQALEKEGSLLSKQEGRTLCRQSHSEFRADRGVPREDTICDVARATEAAAAGMRDGHVSLLPGQLFWRVGHVAVWSHHI